MDIDIEMAMLMVPKFIKLNFWLRPRVTTRPRLKEPPRKAKRTVEALGPDCLLALRFLARTVASSSGEQPGQETKYEERLTATSA